ncbi:hypothetical protein Tco_0883864 [Tanacetum coccineum]
MRIDELYKFSDGTLNDVWTALDDHLKGIRIQYLPQTIWRASNRDKPGAMIQAIDKLLKTRRIMRSLEKFIGHLKMEVKITCILHATYGKIRVDDDFHDLRSVETKFPAIVVNDTFASQNALPCESQDFLYDFETEISNNYMAPLPPREQRHPFLRYQGLEYTDADIADFEERLERIYSREIHRVQVVDFQGMPELMRDGLFARMVMEHRDDAGVVFLSTLRFGEVLLDLDAPDTIQFQLGGARRRLSWRQFILALRSHTEEEMESPGFARYWSESERMNPGKGDLHDYWRVISIDGDFLGPPPSYTLIRDLMLRLCHRMMAHSIAGRSQAPKKVTVTDLFYLRGLDVGSVNIPYLLARYLRRFAAGRKSGAHISVIAPELLIIDMAELVRLQICEQLDDTWAWVAMGPERQPDAAAGAPRVAQDAPVIDEGGQADPAPVQAPPPPPAAARTMPQRMARLEEDVHEIRGTLAEQREVISAMARDFSRFCTWTTTSLARMMDRAGVTYTSYSETPREYTRRVRHRNDDASTSTAQQDPQQPDP